MRVLIIGGYAGSLVNFRGSLIAEMIARGHAVAAAAPDMDPATAQRLETLGARPLSVRFQRTGTNPWKDLCGLWQLWRLMRRERPDVVLSYTIKPAIYGTLAARLAGIDRRFAMITGLGNGLGSGQSLRQRMVALIVRGLCRLALRGCGGVLFQNRDDRRFFLDAGLVGPATPTFVVDGSGVDLAAFAPAPLPEKVVFLMIARLLGEKGVREYVAAAREVRKRYPHAVWRIVGWIDESPGAVRAEELDGWVAEGTVEYLGRLKDVRPAIASSSVYVLPSYYPEGLPRTCLEAMAMGRAIITTDLPGCRETVVAGVNGLLIQPRSTAALATAMEEILGDPALIQRMGDESLRMATDRFDVRLVNNQMLRAIGLADATPV